MENYISTKDEKFNAKLELDNLLKKKGSHGFSRQEAGGMVNLTPKMLIEYEKEFVIWKVDDRTGRTYKWDTRTNTEYGKSKGLIFSKKGDLQLHPALQHYYEKNNIPLPGERGAGNLADIKYLEARLRYEQALSYKNKGDVKTRGLKLNTYNQKIAADKKAGRVLPDGRTVYEASYDGKLNAMETDMNNLYAESSYYKNDTNLLNTQVQSKSKVQAKENELKRKKEEEKRKKEEEIRKANAPKEKVNRYMDIAKEQYKLDTTVNKNPMRDSIKVGPKDVGKTHSLDKLLGLQIEQ